MKKVKQLKFKRMGRTGKIIEMKDGTQYEVQKNGSWKRVTTSPLGYVIMEKEKGKKCQP